MKGVPVNSIYSKKDNFPVVAIGASAGGLGAMLELLKNLPANTGMSFIYIQHLDPDHESHLTEILGRVTEMSVLEAKEKMKIRPNQLYIIPPNRDMTLDTGTLTLNLRPARPQRHLPINNFFTSLAEQYKEKAVGILLSGNGADGTLGLKAIKAAGGITFAQDESAQFGSMSKSAVREGVVDLILPPVRISEELSKLAKHQELYQTAIDEIDEDSVLDKDENLVVIMRLLLRETGVDFSQYKISTIKRRIIRRMILHRMDNLKEYVAYLNKHANEMHQLYRDLLINVTSFFRDPESSDYLKKNLLPKIISSKVQGDPIRIWVPACSSGQEAYTMAILMMEVLGEKAGTTSIQIFATDLSELSINTARMGIYSPDELGDMNPRLLDKYFIKIESSYRIVKSIRDVCIFAIHNVLKDPPFSHVDLISCCNLMIYLEPVLQKKLLATFHYSLNSVGYLILGKAETVSTSPNLFSQVDKKLKIYTKKKDVASRATFQLSYQGRESDQTEVNARQPMVKKSNDQHIDILVNEVLLKKYTPACVVVNGDLDIIQFRGSTGLFLDPSPGKASLNLLKMARPALAFELRNLVHKSVKSSKPEIKSWMEPTADNRTKQLTIECVPVKNEGHRLDQYFLVVFDELSLPSPEIQQAHTIKDKRVKQLEDELNTLREDMRSVLEEQEAANEELQSVNEEIVSSNEELQSINEELETSKEELESSNEELITINQELQMRNEQLAEVVEYSDAIFTTIRESLLILDSNLRIKNANSCFFRTFKVTKEETEGKFIYELGNKQWNIPRLKELLEHVIPGNAEVSDFEVTHNFPGLGEKNMVVNARRLSSRLRNEEFILLAIEDITQYKQGQRIIQEQEEWFHSLTDNSPVMIWVAGLDKNIQYVNKAWLDYRDKELPEVIGKSWIEEMHPEDEDRIKKLFDHSFARQKPFTDQYRLKHGSRYRPILIKGAPNYNHTKGFIGFIGSCVELPEDGKED